MSLILTVVAAAALGPLAVRYGAESRPGFDERPEPRDRRRNL